MSHMSVYIRICLLCGLNCRECCLGDAQWAKRANCWQMDEALQRTNKIKRGFTRSWANSHINITHCPNKKEHQRAKVSFNLIYLIIYLTLSWQSARSAPRRPSWNSEKKRPKRGICGSGLTRTIVAAGFIIYTIYSVVVALQISRPNPIDLANKRYSRLRISSRVKKVSSRGLSNKRLSICLELFICGGPGCGGNLMK